MLQMPDRPTTPMRYLKSLGVFRALSAKSPDVVAVWDGVMHLSPADVETAHAYLLHDWTPTPITSPWNAGSGYDKRTTELERIRGGKSPRHHAYRQTIEAGHRARARDLKKRDLIMELRNTLPDVALDWLDTAVRIEGDDIQYASLLGTGGNHGRSEFSQNYMRALNAVIDPDTGAPKAWSESWLWASLTGEPIDGLLDLPASYFAPGGRLVNPWDYVLCIEGACTFAASAFANDFATSRRPEKAADAGKFAVARPELDGPYAREAWVPIWHTAMPYRVLRHLGATSFDDFDSDVIQMVPIQYLQRKGTYYLPFMGPVRVTLGQQILTSRARAGMTQAELAADVGTSQSRISEWERDDRAMALSTLEKVATSLGAWFVVGPTNATDPDSDN